MLNVKELTTYIGNRQVVKDVSCQLGVGITVFIGPSGAGKTSLLKSIIGLRAFAQGTISLDGKRIDQLTPRERCKKIGYVFQDFNLFAHLNVMQNCIDPLLIQGMDPAVAHQRAISMLVKLGIAQLNDAYPAQLSGGQKQRVALARSLCLQPSVLLLDEPSASLDPGNTRNLIQLCAQLKKDGFIVGLSTQDMTLARRLFDRIYYIADGALVAQADRHQEMYPDCIQAFLHDDQ